VIYLFTVACSERWITTWWARLFDTDRSYCFDRLTELVEPEATLAARFDWLDSLSACEGFEAAQRHAVLRGFPDYFERHWAQGRLGPFHIGNADHAVQRLLPGLWLLWPDMRFLFVYRNGVAAVDREAHGDGRFERACREWAEDVARLRAHQTWLVERGAAVRETRLERLVARDRELGDLWTALPGNWERYSAEKQPLVAELATELEPADEVWSRWSQERRHLFEVICGPAQQLLGYPSRPRRRRWHRIRA
jgi:hypothetical protein